MYEILELTKKLASQKTSSVRAIKNRVAYVVPDEVLPRYGDNTLRTQWIAQSLNTHGLEVLCFGMPMSMGGSGFQCHGDSLRLSNIKEKRFRYFDCSQRSVQIETESEHLKYSAATLVERFKVFRPSAVVSVSDWRIGLPAWVAATTLGIDFYSEVRTFTELGIESGVADTLLQLDSRLVVELESFISKEAKAVFTRNTLMKGELVNRGVDEQKILVVTDGVVPSSSTNPSSHALREKLGIKPDERVIACFGPSESYEDLTALLDACADLVRKREKVKLLLVDRNIGPGQRFKDDGSESAATAIGLTCSSKDPSWSIDLCQEVFQERREEYYALSDVVVIPRKQSTLWEFVPSVMAAEALAYGKRLLVPDLGPLVDYADRYASVASYVTGSSESIAAAIQELLKLPASTIKSELILAEHIEPMVRVLKGQGSEPEKVVSSLGNERGQGRSATALMQQSGPIALQSASPTWVTFEVSEGHLLSISAKVQYCRIPSGQCRKAVLLLQGKNASGSLVDKPLGKLAKSGHLKSHFLYLNCSHGKATQLHNFTVPAGVAQVSLGLCGFNYRDDEEVVVRDLVVHDLSANALESVNVISTMQELTKAPHWSRFAVEELIPHSVTAALNFETEESRHAKSAILRVIYYDKDQQEIPPPYSGLPLSKAVGAFSYISAKGDRLAQLMPPRGAVEVAIGLQHWNAKGKVWLKGDVACLAEIQSREDIDSFIRVARAKSTVPARRLADIKVAAILDEFTMECFRLEVALTAITPNDWERQMEEAQPDLLFVESCWFGNGNTWSGLMYGYTSNGPNRMDDLLKVITYCRKRGIPTVFWSKEDPVHFTRFGPTAKLFDYVYTTDANMVAEYRKEYGIEAEPLSFFCQPRLHNPIPWIARNDKAAFAGSYYSDKIERCENFHVIMKGLELAGVEYDIYDRCLKRGVAHLEFPEQFKKHVVGYLEPRDMWRAYKGYRFTVNLNTVKHSPTMFARRVYESLASGTPVISNYSEGVITQFGGVVCASDHLDAIVAYVERLRDPEAYAEISAQGVRETLGRHTLADRLEQVCGRLGIPVVPHLPLTNAVYTAGTVQEVEKVRAHFMLQGYHRKRLIVNLENSNLLYPYLNRNSEDEVFRVLTEFAKPLEGIELPMSLDQNYPETYLEDAAIKTQYQSDIPAGSKEAAV